MSRRGCFSRLRRWLLGYLLIGLAVSIARNTWALWHGEPTAFAWAGSLGETAALWLWWLLIPALVWPWDLFWALWHTLRR